MLHLLLRKYTLQKQFIINFIIILLLIVIRIHFVGVLLEIRNGIEYLTDVSHVLYFDSLSFSKLEYFVHILQFLANGLEVGGSFAQISRALLLFLLICIGTEIFRLLFGIFLVRLVEIWPYLTRRHHVHHIRGAEVVRCPIRTEWRRWSHRSRSLRCSADQWRRISAPRSAWVPVHWNDSLGLRLRENINVEILVVSSPRLLGCVEGSVAFAKVRNLLNEAVITDGRVDQTVIKGAVLQIPLERLI